MPILRFLSQNHTLKPDSILNEITVRYRRRKIKNLATTITNSNDAINLLKQLYDQDGIHFQEEFIAIFLNNANEVIGYQKLSRGGMNATIVDMRILFSLALKTLSSAIIISHNHPSGNLKPSHNDFKLTEKIRDAGLILDVKLLDHIIVSPTFAYFSFLDEGRL